MRTPATYYIAGVTCVGKDFLIERAVKKYPDIFGAVQVGKEFRRRYPPEHFKGKGAMPSTRNEAYNIFVEQFAQARKKPKILVAGQPREKEQVQRICVPNPGKIIWLSASDETIEKRLAVRFANDVSSANLSKQRLTNDRIQLYDVLHEAVSLGIPIWAFNVDTMDVDSLIQILLEDIDVRSPISRR